MSHRIPTISGPLPPAALRGPGRALCGPAHLANVAGEIGAVMVGRRPFVVVNSAELTRLALAECADAFVPASAAGSFAWRMLSNGTLIRATQLDGVRAGVPARGIVAALHAQANLAAAFAERLCLKRKQGAAIDLDGELTQLMRWIATRRLLDLGDMPDLADEIGASLNAYGLSGSHDVATLPGSERADRAHGVRRAAVRTLRSALERAIRERRASSDGAPGLVGALANSMAAAHEHGDRALSVELTSALVLALETIRIVMSRVWPLLLDYPAAGARLQEEITSTLHGRTPEYGDLRRLPYTRQVIREVLRLHPPVAMFSRRLARDVQVGEYDVPGGSVLVFNTRRILRCADGFAAPDVFSPDRFGAGENAARRPDHELAFGGSTASAMERHVFSLTQIVLATVAQRFAWAPKADRYTIAVAESHRSHHRPAEIRIERHSRRLSPRYGGRPGPVPLLIDTRRHANVRPSNGSTGGTASMILTCEALRSAL